MSQSTKHIKKMDTIFVKLLTSLREKGLTKTGIRIFVRVRQLCLMREQKIFSAKILNMPSVEERFTWIYEKNFWGSKESFSGTGSTLQYTENLRCKLPEIFKKFSIKSVFDAPCGDFNWMKKFLQEVNIRYIGGDIVAPLIDHHSTQYGKEGVEFIHIDLIKDNFPSADLMICRDCIFHLSYEDTFSVLKGFLRSGIPYLLTSSHKNIDAFKNHDIKTGDFRFIDLFSAPYHFPYDPLFTIEDWLPPDIERYMCLWSREQVSKALSLHSEASHRLVTSTDQERSLY